jgi:uncharacterized protein YbjT (DUF2867 family)
VVRDPQKYAGKFGSAEVVQGSVTDEASMQAAFKGASGVIFAAAASTFNGCSEVDHLGVGKAARAAKTNGVQKFVLCTSRLVNPVNFWDPIRILLNTVKWGNMDSKFRGEELLRSAGLSHYVVVRPGGLAGGEGPNVRPTDRKPGKDHLVAGAAEADIDTAANGNRSIHRADVAAVMCQALTTPEGTGKTIEIVARAPEGGEPTIEQQLACVFDAIPQDKKSSTASELSAQSVEPLSEVHSSCAQYSIAFLVVCSMVGLAGIKKIQNFKRRPGTGLRVPLIY